MLLRVSLIIAILAGIGTIVVTQVVAKKQIQQVITERQQHIKQENDERTGRKKAETELAATKTTLQQTKDTLAKTEEELNNTKQQLAAANADLQKNKADLATAITARKDVEAQLEKWRQLGMTVEQVLALKNDYKKATDAIVALDEEKKILARRAQELSNKIDDLMGVDRPVELPTGTKGKIVAVDPKWNFVVLNIGKDKGVLERGVLLVHRESKYIGKVRIAEVQDTRCIATVMPGTTLDEIQEGDQVLY